MYIPPQSSLSSEQPTYEDFHKLGVGFFDHLQHPHTEPFSYQYILEEGKLPVLAEYHPKKRASQYSKILPTQPKIQPSQNIQRTKSLRKPVKNLQFDMSSYKIPKPPQERTSDKLKRAFSLSGMRSHSQSRRVASSESRPLDKDIPIPRHHLTIAPPAPESRVPSLVLPTPSPSPEPTRDSFNSTNYKTPVNYSLPRSSWASYEDDFDIAFLRESALGRLSPSPLPTTELRRDKALALLGITDMPFTPPFTPSASRVPSLMDHHSRHSSRRPSMENRRSQYVPQLEETKQLPAIPTIAEQDTPKASRQGLQHATSEQESSLATPRPQLKRKTSKFIEHLDTNAETLQLSLSPPLVIVTESEPRMERSNTAPILTLPQAHPQPPRIASPVQRSLSMRTQSPNPSTWGAVVCTAQATPIVAAGYARIIQS